ncbi:MAG: hypothetical protein ACM3XR_05580 [Bacillota bacterium]
MKQYIKCGVKILYSYIISLIVFVIFLYPFMGLTGEKLYVWLPLYSFLMFLLASFIIYVEMKDQGIKEKKPQNNMNPYPLKGAVYGLIGIVPLLLVFAVALAIPVADQTMNNIRHIAVNAFLGPLYFFFKLFNESLLGYVASIMLLPVISTLGYLTGYFGFNLKSSIFKKKEITKEPEFKKSPWNPTLNQGKKSGAKKKKKSSH